MDAQPNADLPIVPAPTQINSEDLKSQLIPIIASVFSGLKSLFSVKWYKYLFDLLILLAVVIPISILGWKGVLTENTLGTLFGGIIGYTLTRFKKSEE